MTRTVLLVAGVLVLGALITLILRSDVVDLAASGGIRELRDDLRPIRGETRVLLIGMDGVGAPILYQALREGRMPNVTELVGAPIDTSGLWEHAYGAIDALSVLPAETTAGWAAVLTGARPSESGVPGNEWFVRDSLAFYAPVPLSVDSYAHTLRIYTDGLVGARIQVPTLFERVDELRSHVALGFVSRGADVFTPPDLGRLPLLLKNLLETALGREGVDSELYETLDYHAVIGARNAAEKYGLPDLQFAYFPGVDLLTHESESALERQREYLEKVIDPAVGELVELYRSRGALEQTYVVVVADHGHTPALADDRHALDEEPRALLDSLGLRVRDAGPGRDDAARYDAVFAANEAFAYIYLADRSTCPMDDDLCDWSRPPRLDEDLLPVARAFRDADETGARLAALRGTLDLILVREPAAPRSGPAPYRVLDGDSLVAMEVYLARNPRPDLASFRERMEWLTDGPFAYLAGDVALLAIDGPEIPIENRYYFSAPYHSGHGSASAQDGTIPLLLTQPQTSGDELRALFEEIVGPEPSQLSVTPLIEGLLTRNLLGTRNPL